MNAVAYYRHVSVQPQEIMTVTMKDQPWEDCVDPAMLRELIGFDDPLPYVEPFAFPTLVSTGA